MDLSLPPTHTLLVTASLKQEELNILEGSVTVESSLQTEVDQGSNGYFSELCKG